MKVGVALSGGGMRGIAHAGVLKAFEDYGIKIDVIGGTSAGSMVASLYAIGYKTDEIFACFQENSSKILGKEKFKFLKGIKNLISKKSNGKGFKNGENIEKVFNELSLNKNVDKISNIEMPIVIPTVDIKDSKEYIFTNYIPKINFDNQKTNNEKEYITEIGVGEAVRASSSFPAVFNLCTIEKHAFIDGGALDNVPVEEVRKQGADIVIAVKFDEDKINDDSSVMDIIMKTIDIMGSKIAEQNIEKSDFVLNINTGKMGLLDTKNIEKCFNSGYEAVKNNIEKIQKIILR